MMRYKHYIEEMLVDATISFCKSSNICCALLYFSMIQIYEKILLNPNKRDINLFYLDLTSGRVYSSNKLSINFFLFSFLISSLISLIIISNSTEVYGSLLFSQSKYVR